MRHLAWLTAAGLLLAPLGGNAAEPKKEGATCAAHGTTIDFYDTPTEAARAAIKAEKLVFVLHVSGYFEDPKFTWNNAEALRVNAFANPEVGKFINEHFCASFQKVATFRIVGNQKQGGNVAAYFCAPDSRVLHVVAGPVNADQMLREAKWVVDTVKKAIAESKDDGIKFKSAMRKAHAEKLRQEYGLVVEAVPIDIAPQDPNSALTYNDPTGRPLAPKLPPPPIDGPDVTFRAQAKAAGEGAPAMDMVRDRAGRAWVLPNGGRVHQIMAAYSLGKIETVYGTVFENILGEKVSTKPVEVATPFPWKGRDATAR